MSDADLTDEINAAIARRSTAASRAAAVTPGQASNLADYQTLYPHMGAASIPLALTNIPAESQVARTAAQGSLAAQRARKKVGQETTGGALSRFWGGVKDTTKSIVRYGAAGAQFPLELVQGAVRSTAAEVGIGHGQGYTIGGGGAALLKQTTIGAGVAEAHDRGQLGSMLLGHGDEALTGNGWFISPGSITGKRQAREAAAANTIDGHAFTIGRGVAALTPLEPGSTGYNIVSGTTDFVGAIALDPLTYVGGSFSKTSRARNVMDAGKLVERTLPTKARLPAGTHLVDPSDLRRYAVHAGGAGETDAARATVNEALRESLRTSGYDMARAGERGGPRLVIDRERGVARLADGNHRTNMAADEGVPHIPVTIEEGKIPARTPAQPYHGEFDTLLGTRAAADVGLIDGTRKTVLPEKFASWLDSDKGSVVSGRLADISPEDPEAFTKIWRGTGKKLPVDLVVKLVDATDPVDVKNLLADAASEGKARDLIRLQSKKPPARLAGMMPGPKFDLDDLGDTVEQADRIMRNAKMPEAEISTRLLDIARSGTKGERFQLIDSLLGSVKATLKTSGFSEGEAASYVRSFKDARDGNRLYHVDMIADGATVRSFRLGGTDIEIDGPHLSTQLIERHMPIPDSRAIKNALRKNETLRTVQASAPYKVSADVADFVTQDMFKPMALLPRVAYPIRVIGEEQARMKYAGFTSAFNHPLSYIAMIVADKPTVPVEGIKVGKMSFADRFAAAASDHAPVPGEAFTEDVPSLLHQWLSKHKDAEHLGSDALGHRFEDEDLVKGVSQWTQAMSKDAGGWADRVIEGAARHWIPVKPDDPEFIDGWQHELVQFASDPMGRELARHGPEVTKHLMWQGNLSGLRKEMAASLRDTKGRLVNLNDKATLDAFVDAEHANLRKLTAAHPDLLQAVATGRLRGHSLTEGLQPGKGAHAELDNLLAEGHHPPLVRGQIKDTGKGSGAHKMVEHYENTVQNMFRLMMSVPTNRLSRSKVFKQAYWKRMEETQGLLTKSEQVRAVRAAKDAGVPKAQVARMRAAAQAATVHGKLTVEDVDDLAKAHGLITTRDLLYSLHEKAQIADALRVVFPFGEAWREVLTRWTKITAQNPLVLHRAAQGIQGAEAAGFFYPDPTTGQEMFAIPGSEWATDKMVGVPMKLDAPLAGLNMFGTVLPGVGPVVTYPVSKFLPDTPTTDFVRSQVLPFGDPDTGGGLLESLFPSYWRKLQAGVSSHASERSKRQLLATTRDVAAYLMSTGDYDLSTPEGQQRLQDDAKAKGRALFIIRSLAQGVAPSAPQPHFFEKDKTGALHTLYELQADYRKMQDHDYTTATQRFIDKWGDLAFLGTIARTTGPNATTDRVNDLVRAHPDQAKRFPDIIGLFAPGGSIDPGEIERQIQAGSRDVIGVQDAVTLSNIRLANAQYDQAKAQVGDKPTDQQRQWLWTVQELLVKKYPGYTGTAGDLSKGPGSVAQLVRAAADPVLAKTDAGQGLAIYLQAREQALSAARKAGYKGFDSAQAMAPWRTWLQQSADVILDAHPDFVDMWDRVLSREVED